VLRSLLKFANFFRSVQLLAQVRFTHVYADCRTTGYRENCNFHEPMTWY